MFDERERPDIFDHLNAHGLEGLETEPTHDSSVRELEDLLETYVIHREEDEIEDYEYRYITTVRIYTHETVEILLRDLVATLQGEDGDVELESTGAAGRE